MAAGEQSMDAHLIRYPTTVAPIKHPQVSRNIYKYLPVWAVLMSIYKYLEVYRNVYKNINKYLKIPSDMGSAQT